MTTKHDYILLCGFSHLHIYMLSMCEAASDCHLTTCIMMLCNYFCCSLTLFPFCTLKGYLENTEKDRIRRLIRLKPPAEFWTKRFLVYTVYWRQWWSGLGQMIVSRNSTLKIFTYIVMFCCAFYVVMIRFENFFYCVLVGGELAWSIFA